jgi:hypothetical protein
MANAYKQNQFSSNNPTISLTEPSVNLVKVMPYLS